MDEKILGIPVGYTTHVVYYNKDLFDKAGVAYPKDNCTWDDLKEAAKKLTDKDKKIYGFAFSEKPDPYDFEMFLWNNGTQYAGKDSKVDGNLNSNESLKVFESFQNMEKDGIAIATKSGGEDEMKSGKVAMFINGAWSLNTFKEIGINYDVVALPAFNKNKKSVSIISSSGVSICNTSKNKDAAWEFVKYWTAEEANKARIGYELPVLKNVTSSEKLLDDPIYSVFYKMLDQISGYIPTSYKFKNWNELSEKLSLAFEKIFNSTVYMNPKDALDEVIE